MSKGPGGQGGTSCCSLRRREVLVTAPGTSDSGTQEPWDAPPPRAPPPQPQVYEELQKQELDEALQHQPNFDDNRPVRTMQEMEEEAAVLRELFPKNVPRVA